MTANYFPADWVTFDGTFAYDNRSAHRPRLRRRRVIARRRSSTNTNFGNADIAQPPRGSAERRHRRDAPAAAHDVT